MLLNVNIRCWFDSIPSDPAAERDRKIAAVAKYLKRGCLMAETVSAILDPVLRSVLRRWLASLVRTLHIDEEELLDDAIQALLAPLSLAGYPCEPALRAFDPVKGCFKTWVIKVVKSRWISEKRRRKEVTLENFQTLPVKAPDDSGATHGTRYTVRFGKADIRQMLARPLRDRLLALAMSGLWEYVEPSLWDRWWNSLLGFPEFPAESLAMVDRPSRRIRILADKLECTRGCLSQIKSRCEPWLMELPGVRHLFDSER